MKTYFETWKLEQDLVSSACLKNTFHVFFLFFFQVLASLIYSQVIPVTYELIKQVSDSKPGIKWYQELLRMQGAS